MLTDRDPVIGTVLLLLALLASSVAAWLLWRMRARTLRAKNSDPGRTPAGALLALGVAAVCAATGAAALSDGTMAVGGWWPFGAGLAVSALPLVAAGAWSRRSG